MRIHLNARAFFHKLFFEKIEKFEFVPLTFAILRTLVFNYHRKFLIHLVCYKYWHRSRHNDSSTSTFTKCLPGIMA